MNCYPAMSPEWRGKQNGIAEERRLIVAWLRDPKNDCAGFEWIADAIERGAHRGVPQSSTPPEEP